nr:hypothetical protein [Mesorhizobium sp.]
MRPDLAADPIEVHRFRNVLERPLAQIVEYERGIAADMIEERSAHIDRVWFGCRLYARREVDAVSDQIIALHHDIRNMETEPHPKRFGVGLLRACKRAADLECTAHGVYGARKFGEGSITRRLENPAVEQIDLFRNKGLTASQPFRGLLLGSLHHSGIADDIGYHQGGHSALHGRSSFRGRPIVGIITAAGGAVVADAAVWECSALQSRPHRETRPANVSRRSPNL